MDRLDAMRVILAVVDAGSLSAGSRRLGAPLPSVSRKVAELGRHLGTNLLVRTSRNIQLTDAGRDYIESARRIIADLEEAERRASGEYQAPRGELTVTMPVEFGNRHVLPLALAFMKEHPEVRLRLITADRMLHLVEDQVDVAIRLGHLADSGLYAVKAGEFHLITCASPTFHEQRGAPDHPVALPDHDGILFGTHPMFWTYRVDGEEVVSSPRTRILVNTAAADRQLRQCRRVRPMSGIRRFGLCGARRPRGLSHLDTLKGATISTLLGVGSNLTVSSLRTLIEGRRASKGGATNQL